ncbi:MAG: hypothetical protein ACRDNS_12520 [Trebonia sp.]
MSYRMPAATSGDQDEPVDGGYFTALASAKQMLLTAADEDGRQASAVVRGVVVGDRAYIQTWDNTDAARKLRRGSDVQVAPCAARGLVLLAPPVSAFARQLPDHEAKEIAGKLPRQPWVQRRLLAPLLHRDMVHYELLAYETAT